MDPDGSHVSDGVLTVAGCHHAQHDRNAGSSQKVVGTTLDRSIVKLIDTLHIMEATRGCLWLDLRIHETRHSRKGRRRTKTRIHCLTSCWIHLPEGAMHGASLVVVALEHSKGKWNWQKRSEQKSIHYRRHFVHSHH